MPLLIDPDFSRLPDGLAGLFAAAAETSFFNHPAWYAVFAAHALEPGGEARLYTDASAGAGLLLQRPGSVPGRQLRSLANYYSCAHAALLRPDVDAATALTAVVAEVLGERPRWDSLLLTVLDPAADDFTALDAAFRRFGMVVRPYFDCGVWYQQTQGLSFAGYVAGLPSQLRNTWTRKRRKLAGSPRLRLTYCAGEDGLDDAIAAYEAVYRASWKEPEPNPGFMPALMRACAVLGALRLAVYHLDGEPAAAQFWIVWRGRATIFKLAHDERFIEHSLGTLLTMELMERVLENDRPIEIDFGHGDDAYKKLWLPLRRERWGLLAANPRTPRGLALSARESAARLYRRLRPAPDRG
ncbi:MAG TPA: GNAT family N-acetyltransferase [Aliidongia sp.]|uniref:GNAT family N-acetyltransferase n=1 Tax=Aliidongia sp. TaxID=1914230 RepID=UPI002DDCA09B|nr:GNAT family N-acetyltransferase [Aliidongia sp.]HEV2677308.1 GNAT family N-acetyltransferase [Aliidongia sp.]